MRSFKLKMHRNAFEAYRALDGGKAGEGREQRSDGVGRKGLGSAFNFFLITPTCEIQDIILSWKTGSVSSNNRVADPRLQSLCRYTQYI